MTWQSMNWAKSHGQFEYIIIDGKKKSWEVTIYLINNLVYFLF